MIAVFTSIQILKCFCIAAGVFCVLFGNTNGLDLIDRFFNIRIHINNKSLIVLRFLSVALTLALVPSVIEGFLSSAPPTDPCEQESAFLAAKKYGVDGLYAFEKKCETNKGKYYLAAGDLVNEQEATFHLKALSCLKEAACPALRCLVEYLHAKTPNRVDELSRIAEMRIGARACFVDRDQQNSFMKSYICGWDDTTNVRPSITHESEVDISNGLTSIANNANNKYGIHVTYEYILSGHQNKYYPGRLPGCDDYDDSEGGLDLPSRKNANNKPEERRIDDGSALDFVTNVQSIIPFERGLHFVSNGNRVLVENAARWFIKHENYFIAIEAHSDGAPDSENLADQRASAISEIFESYGIQPSRLKKYLIANTIDDNSCVELSCKLWGIDSVIVIPQQLSHEH